MHCHRTRAVELENVFGCDTTRTRCTGGQYDAQTRIAAKEVRPVLARVVFEKMRGFAPPPRSDRKFGKILSRRNNSKSLSITGDHEGHACPKLSDAPCLHRLPRTFPPPEK